jgi:hypothetical protein
MNLFGLTYVPASKNVLLTSDLILRRELVAPEIYPAE